MIVSLDLHDFSILRSRMDLLRTLKEHHPNIKISLFTIPSDYEYERDDLRLQKDIKLRDIQENADWMEFIPHGLTHMPREFEKCDRQTMDTYLDNVIPEMIKSGLPTERIREGFCAPFWLWNQDVIDALDKRGWWGAVNRDDPRMLRTKKSYKYTHSIDEPFWETKDEVWKLHGHMTLPSSNNLEDCILNLLKIPADAEWKFVSELI